MKEEMYNLVRHENKRTRYTNGNCIFIVSLEMNLIKGKSEKWKPMNIWARQNSKTITSKRYEKRIDGGNMQQLIVPNVEATEGKCTKPEGKNGDDRDIVYLAHVSRFSAEQPPHLNSKQNTRLTNKNTKIDHCFMGSETFLATNNSNSNRSSESFISKQD